MTDKGQDPLGAWQGPAKDAFDFWVSFFPTAPLFGVEWRFANMVPLPFNMIETGSAVAAEKPKAATGQVVALDRVSGVAPRKPKRATSPAKGIAKPTATAKAATKAKPAPAKTAAPKADPVKADVAKVAPKAKAETTAQPKAAAAPKAAPAPNVAEKPSATVTPLKAVPDAPKAAEAPKTAAPKPAAAKSDASKPAAAPAVAMAKPATSAAPAPKPDAKPASAEAPAKPKLVDSKPETVELPLAAPAGAPLGKPATLMSAPPSTPDDLKLIKGIGPGLEKQLNGLGIYTFGQIAQFTERDLAWVDANLTAFKGRCFRDDWVGQAKGRLN